MRTEQERTAYKKLFAYHINKQIIRGYTERALWQQHKADAPYIGGAYHSDPSARGGLMLAEPPERMKKRMDWCAAIESARAELQLADEANGRGDHGLVYLMERYFCLSGAPRAKERNEDARAELCRDCRISVSGFYARVGRIVDEVVYHARERDLI